MRTTSRPGLSTPRSASSWGCSATPGADAGAAAPPGAPSAAAARPPARRPSQVGGEGRGSGGEAAGAGPHHPLRVPGAQPLPAARDPDADPAWTLRFSSSPPKPAGAPASPTAHPTFTPAPSRPEDHAPFHAPNSPLPDSAWEDPGSPPGRPENHATPPSAPPSLNAALLQTLGHLGDIVAILGPLRDQLLTLNQHVEQLRGSFDQTVSLAVGFILGSAAAERGILADPRE